MTAEAAAPATSRSEALPLVAAAITLLLWASAFVAIRKAGQEISPGAMTLARLAVGSVILGITAFARGVVRRPTGRELRLLLICGVCWFGIYNVSLNEAERHMDAGIAAMVVNVGPIIIAVLAGAILHEGFPRTLFLGSAMGLAGVIVIGLSTARDARADVTGIVLCVVAALTYAIGVVSQKPLLRRLPAVTVTWFACLIGTACVLPFAPALVHDLASAHPLSVGLVVYLGAFPTAIAFSLWAYALSHTTAGRMGATTLLVPPIAILLGWLLLGETPSWLALAGGAVALAGVAIARRTR